MTSKTPYAIAYQWNTMYEILEICYRTITFKHMDLLSQ